jgi:hypothetical protein
MRSEPPARLEVSRLASAVSGVALVALLLVPLQKLAWAFEEDTLAYDFRQAFLPAAERLLDGDSPYPGLGYPPLVAFVSAPFALLPSPELLAAIAVAACLPASLWLLGVRDWRCYVVSFLWIATFNAIQTANVTLPLLLAASVCWRWRERTSVTSVAGGLAVATKLIAWPLTVWLAATRRWTAAIGTLAVAAGVTLALWSVLGFSGFTAFPASLDRLQDEQGDRGYTFQALALDAGLPEGVGLLAALAVLLSVLALVVVYAQRGDETRSFACAAVGLIVASPIIWLHSFVLLVAPVALLRPRLSAVWFLPATLAFVSPGTGNGTAWQTLVTVSVAALVVVVVLIPEGRLPILGRRTELVREQEASQFDRVTR